MAQSKKPYMVVWFALFILTVLEVLAAIYFTSTAKWLSLVVIAVAKAGAVGWWYMHLKTEYGWLKFIAVLPVIAAVYAVVLMKEVVAR